MVCPGEGIGWVANAMSFAGAAFDGYIFIVVQFGDCRVAKQLLAMTTQKKM
jgi:hypothetical protein